jgi:DNA-binding GntR family transcriptional regulator
MAERLDPVTLDFDVDRNSPVPLWHQLSEAIHDAIRTRRLEPGERLETETKLSARLGLSRPTVRQAIQVLVHQGVLVRKQGIGTQVVQPRRSRDPSQMSLFEDLRRSGQQPSTRLLEWTSGTRESLECVEFVGDAIGPGADMVRVRRLRLADDAPLAILINYMPVRAELTPEDVAQRGLYGALRAIGIQPKLAHLTIGARELTAEEAKLLGEPRRSTGITSERSVFDGSGQFVEFGQHVYRASRYTIEMNLVG